MKTNEKNAEHAIRDRDAKRIFICSAVRLINAKKESENFAAGQGDDKILIFN